MPFSDAKFDSDATTASNAVVKNPQAAQAEFTGVYVVSHFSSCLVRVYFVKKLFKFFGGNGNVRFLWRRDGKVALWRRRVGRGNFWFPARVFRP